MELLIIGLCGQSVFMRVEHFHRPEETLHASSLFTEPGGKGYNQAVAAARMGVQVTFAGAVGQDTDGESCIMRLLQEGIEPAMTRKCGRTAYASILTDAAGENRVTVFAGVQLSAQDVAQLAPLFMQAQMLLLTPEIPQEAFDAAMELAARYDVRVVINPAPYVPWVKPYLEQAWLITPNRSEACSLLECAPEDLEAAAKAAPYKRMVITLGGEGALCAENGVTARIAAPEVEVVDTTGAGDCLNGVLCARLLAGDTLMDALQKAVAAAAESVAHAYVLDGMPHAELKE